MRRLRPCDNYIWYNIDRSLLKLFYWWAQGNATTTNKRHKKFRFYFDNYEWCDSNKKMRLWFAIEHTHTAKWLWLYFISFLILVFFSFFFYFNICSKRLSHWSDNITPSFDWTVTTLFSLSKWYNYFVQSIFFFLLCFLLAQTSFLWSNSHSNV